MRSGLIGQWPSRKVAKIYCQALRLACKVSNFDLHVNFPCFNFLKEIFELFSSNIKLQPGKSYHPSIPKELEVMDNFNPAEPIP